MRRAPADTGPGACLTLAMRRHPKPFTFPEVERLGGRLHLHRYFGLKTWPSREDAVVSDLGVKRHEAFHAWMRARGYRGGSDDARHRDRQGGVEPRAQAGRARPVPTHPHGLGWQDAAHGPPAGRAGAAARVLERAAACAGLHPVGARYGGEAPGCPGAALVRSSSSSASFTLIRPSASRCRGNTADGPASGCALGEVRGPWHRTANR